MTDRLDEIKARLWRLRKTDEDHPVVEAMVKVRQRNAGNFDLKHFAERDDTLLDVVKEVQAYLSKGETAADITWLADEVTRLRAENAGLREALKPFATEAKEWPASVPSGSQLYLRPPGGYEGLRLTLGHLRKTLEALASLAAPKDGGEGAVGGA